MKRIEENKLVMFKAVQAVLAKNQNLLFNTSFLLYTENIVIN